MKVVVVGCDANGNIDINDLKAKIEKHRHDLSCIMITYLLPTVSTKKPCRKCAN